MHALHVASSLDNSVPLEEVREISIVLGWPKHSFIQVFPFLFIENPKCTFWPTQYLARRVNLLVGVLVQTWTLKTIIFVIFCLCHQITLSPLLLLEIQLAVAIMKALPLLISRVMMVFNCFSAIHIAEFWFHTKTEAIREKTREGEKREQFIVFVLSGVILVEKNRKPLK